MGITKAHLYLLLGVLASATSGASAALVDAEKCVAGIPGLTFFNQSSPGYSSVSLPFNRRLNPTPTVVTIP